MHRERSANSPSSSRNSNSKISSMNTDNNIDEEENSNDDRSSYIANENPIIIDDTSHSSEEYDYENRPSISSLTSEYNYVVDQVVKKRGMTVRHNLGTIRPNDYGRFWQSILAKSYTFV